MTTQQLRIGNIYAHPNDGPIRIVSGDYLVNGRISNHWHWVVIATGERKNGYGAPWRDISNQYVTVTIPRAMLQNE